MAKKLHTAIVFLFLLFLIGFAFFGSKIINDLNVSMLAQNIPKKEKINFSSDISISYVKLQLKNSTLILNATQPYEIAINDSILGIPYGDVKIFNFYGELVIDNGISNINGNFTKISSTSFNLTKPNSPIIISNKSFSFIKIENAYFDRLKLNNASGFLEISNINITIKSEDIQINSLESNISYQKNMIIKGFCKEINIGDRLLISSS